MKKCQQEFEKYCNRINKKSFAGIYDIWPEKIFSQGWKAAKADTKTKKVKKNADK